MVILYNTIELQYVVTGDLSYLSHLLFLYILKSTKKSVKTYFRLYKPVQFTENTKRKFNIRIKKIEKRWGNGIIKTIPPT